MNYSAYFKEYYKNHPVTSIIIIINLLMALLVMFTGGFTLNNLISWGAILPPLITEDGEYYRILTAMALHGSVLHFAMNSYVLFYIGGHLERLIGPMKYLFVYLVAGIVSSLFVVYLGENNIVTIGASGAIFGVMGGLFMLTIKRANWFHPQTVRSIRNLMLINLVFTFIIPNISVLGHLGGLIAGVLLFFVITPEEPYFTKYMVPEARDNYTS